jgi:hypothetical protein
MAIILLVVVAHSTEVFLKRSEAILDLSDFLASFPENASNYHTADMVIRFLQRMKIINIQWEQEDEEDESI